MSPALASAIVAALLAVAALIGVTLRLREGRRRRAGVDRFDASDVGPHGLGARATLVQFSTETCARCPQVRRMLQGYVDAATDVRHLELDLTHRPDIAARYRVLQTPTTLVVDARGVVRARFHGIPRGDALGPALASL